MIMFMRQVRAVAVTIVASMPIVSALSTTAGPTPSATSSLEPGSSPTWTPASINCSIPSDTQTTISNAAQASSLASACPTFTGNITISSIENVALDGMSVLDGTLTANGSNSSIAAITSNSISNITGGLCLAHLPALSTLNFTELVQVGSLCLNGLPAYTNTLSLLDTIQEVDSVDIRSTALASLDGLELQRLSSLSIQDNYNLTSLHLRVVNVTILAVMNNSAELDVVLPDLQWVHNLTLANCSKVAIPSLTHVNDTLHLTGNSFSTFDNASTVHSIGDDLWINNNMNLSNITLPELHSVGGHIVIDNNPKLGILDEVIKLESIGGNVQMNGSFSSISFPSLTNVNGSFALNSSAELDCSIFDTYYKDGVISGNYTCHTPDSTIVKNRNVTTPHDLSHALSPTVKIGLGLGIPLASLAVAASAALFFLHRMKTKMNKSKKSEDKDDRLELSGDSAVIELGDGKAFSELGRTHSRSVSGPEQRHELHDTSGPSELNSPIIDNDYDDNERHMDVIIGTFELEGDSVQLSKPEG